MLIELTLALFLGILAGTFTGLTPGIHTNLLAVFILSLPLSFFSPTILIVFLSAMAITHTFIDFVPSIYLGAPDEDTALGVMPGHNFLLKGNAHEAVILTLIGSVTSIFLLTIITPIFILIIPKIYPFIEKMMSFFLIWVSIFLISKEQNSKIWAFLIFILSGFIGISSLNLSINQSLLPLLTGLFGSSTLTYSIQQKTIIPKQKIGKILINKKEILKPAIATTLISPIFSFLPGLGSSQAAIVSSQIIKQSKKQFLILLGSINTLVMSISFLTLYLIGKSRTGMANAINQIARITPKELLIIFISIILASIASAFLVIQISKIFAKNIHKINYRKISKIIIFLLTFIVLIFSGFLGLLVFVTSTILGLLCIYSGVRRGFLMGALLIPTIIFYLPF